jgi:hypothetical protein
MQKGEQKGNYYWIAAEPKDKKFLEDLGVVLGPYNEDQFDDCLIPDRVMTELDNYWGNFYWGVIPA